MIDFLYTTGLRIFSATMQKIHFFPNLCLNTGRIMYYSCVMHVFLELSLKDYTIANCELPLPCKRFCGLGRPTVRIVQPTLLDNTEHRRSVKLSPM